VRATLEISEATDARLGLEQLNAEDGSARVLAFYDHDEEAACGSFGVGTDPELYCVPASGIVNEYFDDAQCAGEAHRLITDRCPSVVGFSIEEQALYRTGKPARTVPPFYGVEDLCLQSLPVVAYEVGDAVALDSFAALESKHAGTGRLRTYVTDGANGEVTMPNLRDPPILWDEELGVQCEVQTAADDAYRCLPFLRNTHGGGVFADDECTIPLASHTGARADLDEPNWLVFAPASFNDVCLSESPATVYELAEEPFTGTHYAPSIDAEANPICAVSTLDLPYEVFAPVGELAPDRFVRFERKVD
jgi:hypothetical protein